MRTGGLPSKTSSPSRQSLQTAGACLSVKKIEFEPCAQQLNAPLAVRPQERLSCSLDKGLRLVNCAGRVPELVEPQTGIRRSCIYLSGRLTAILEATAPLCARC
ncbi:unnamed protein product [Toxocara canis]|uniref:Uncharacterized protein n=1 Tax=Toxocara canis TaxID=6265 RepID=A0A183USJ4_TOXCA|nr:unnamed protein product [Toxocara canis]